MTHYLNASLALVAARGADGTCGAIPERPQPAVWVVDARRLEQAAAGCCNCTHKRQQPCGEVREGL